MDTIGTQDIRPCTGDLPNEPGCLIGARKRQPTYTVVAFSLHENPLTPARQAIRMLLELFGILCRAAKKIPSTKHLLQVTLMATLNQQSQFDTKKIYRETQSNFPTRPDWPLPPL